MKKYLFLTIAALLSLTAFAQVSEIKWELDYELYLKLANDSNYTYDIRDAFHVTDTKKEFASDFVFYPVNPGMNLAKENSQPKDGEYSTLWSALHAKIGGGWIHFTNCIAYALETKKLDLESPLMKRPESKWKPKPVTDSYKRTKAWMYYVPVNQKNAQKEYKQRESEGALGDILSLPKGYTDLFLATTQKEYDALKANGKLNIVAKIDLVKILLGANFLGEAQITYASNMILEAVQSYSTNMLPSIIVFDEFEAAAVMSLNVEGYKIENIVFRSAANMSAETMKNHKEEIEGIIARINAYNQNSFKQRLGNYYKN